MSRDDAERAFAGAIAGLLLGLLAATTLAVLVMSRGAWATEIVR